MTKDIYTDHQTAFKGIAAYVVLDHQEKLIARVAFKWGNAVTCYFHVLGIAMTKGRANGGGYDRASASAYDAIMKAKALDGADPEMLNLLPRLQKALSSDGEHWDSALTAAGFRVLQAA